MNKCIHEAVEIYKGGKQYCLHCNKYLDKSGVFWPGSKMRRDMSLGYTEYYRIPITSDPIISSLFGEFIIKISS